jgi:hypothetical protein
MSEGRFEVSLHHDGSPTCLGYQSNRVVETFVLDGAMLFGNSIVD